MASKNVQKRKIYKYNIKFHGDRIKTIVTSFAHVVNKWISETYSLHGEKFLVGLDSEWKWDRKEAVVLQLCVDRRCLVYQLFHTNYIPQPLIDFLGDINLTFVGKEIKGDVRLLGRQGLHISRSMDLSHMAVEKYGDKSYKQMGLMALAVEILKKEMKKEKKITMSRWGAQQLSRAQVEYACIDAYVSFLLGDKLQKMCMSEERKQLDSSTDHENGGNNFCLDACSLGYSSNRKAKRNLSRRANKFDKSTVAAAALIQEFIINFDYSSIVATGWDD